MVDLKILFSKRPMEGKLGDFPGLVGLHKVDETKLEAFWDQIVREHHYLGYDSVIGSRVKYLVTLGERLVGAISFCSAAYQLGPRDRFIGWDEPTRLAMLPHLVCNNRFLILPWIRIHNLASRILSLSLDRLKEDWREWYGVEPYMAETFVDRERFSGTCYVAANWTLLGTTRGFGRQGKGFVFHGQPKDLYVKVMSRRFGKTFHPSLDRLQDGRKELLAMISAPPVYWPKILVSLGIAGITTRDIEKALADHLRRYIVYLTRKENTKHFIAMIKGLLSDLERKSIEPICLAFNARDEFRNMCNFMTRSTWDDQGMLEEYQNELSKLLSHPMGMITGDGCGFPKKGSMSVGVARQYCGRLGKVDNCQNAVMVGYAGPNGYGLADFELYMPEKWFGDDFEEKRAKCRVPEGLEFETEPQLLSKMINRLTGKGLFKAKYLGVDSNFGSRHSFLDSLPKELVYFADVKSDCKVFPGRPVMVVPERGGRGGRPQIAKPSFESRTVKELAGDEAVPWEDVVLGMGAKGPIIAKDKCFRVVESRDGKPGKDVWLYVRRLEDGTVKYSLCNESADATMEAIRTPALMRWSIEQCFNECKDYLGMDHYEVRTWQGWRRHMLLTLISHLFATKLRYQFGVMVDEPGPAPIVKAPVPLADYKEAVISSKNKQKIKNPKIIDIPKDI